MKHLERIGKTAVEFIDFVKDANDDLADACIGEVMVIAEIRGIDGDGEQVGEVQFRCSDPRGWVQRGLLEEAINTAHGAHLPTVDE